MIEYGVPLLILAFLFVGLPVGLAVLAFMVARGLIRSAVRGLFRIGMEEQHRARAMHRHMMYR